MQLYTSDKTSPRSFPWLWYIRLVALIITLIVLGITASNTATFHSIGCDAPAKLLYNLAVAVISLVALIYFILASGPSRTTRLLPWFIWGQLVLDALILIFWLSAAATSTYSCTDLCNVCGILDGYVYFDSQSCYCYSDIFYKRNYSPRPTNTLQSRDGHSKRRTRNSTVGGSIAAKQAFDAIMTIIFAIFIAADILWIIKSRKGGTTATAPTNNTPMKTEEGGMPMGGVGAPTYTQQQPGPEYNNNNQMAPQGPYTSQPTQNQHPPEPYPYPNGQYNQAQPQYPQSPTQYPQNLPQYPTQQPSYPPSQQVPSQSYPSPQGEYPPQYGNPPAPQQASYAEPRDGVSEMHSPTQAPKMMDGPHHV